MMKILISEPVHNGEVHLDVNSSFVKIFRYGYPGSSIIYHAEPEHAKAVEDKVSFDQNITYNSYLRYYNTQAYSWLSRLVGEMKVIHRSLKLAKRTKADLCVWTCLFPTGHLFLNLLLLCSRNANNHRIVLHGELEYLKASSGKITEKMFGWILRLALRISGKHTRYIVLGGRIKEHLRSYVTKSTFDKVVSILHPYEYGPENRVYEECGRPGNLLHLGAIGAQTLSKNSQLIFRLAEKLKDSIETDVIKITTIGKILPEIGPFQNTLVSSLYPKDFVPQAAFEHESRKLDFALFFYDNDAYQLCASGALYQVIKLGIPIISIYNDYVDWLFTTYGKMGFICHNLDEIGTLVLEIKAGARNNDMQQIAENISVFRKNHDLQHIADDLFNKLRT